MPLTLNDLAKRFDKLPAEIKTAASKAAVAVSKVVVKDLIFSTPVDTTEALSNWIATLGSPSNNAIPPIVPGNFGNTRSTSASAAYAAAIMVLDAKKPGQIVYLTNNADHIRELDEGKSSQQPAGFVARSAMVGRIYLRSYRLNI